MINERGIWMSKEETDTHVFDKPLCDAIVSILQLMQAYYVADIGCGNGAYTKYLRKEGFNCRGFDGSPLTRELSGGICEIMDFSELVDIGKVDAVLCLEVGEHLPVKYEQVFIDNICIAPNIIMSWAVEGQGGTGHFNCRNNDYIISEMKKRGYEYDKATSGFLRLKSTLPWFKHTLMVFKWNR